MAVITISRLYGIGGRQFGLRLARKLGYEYFDKELLTLLSDRLGRDESRVSLYEEMGYGPSTSLLAMLGRKYPSTVTDLPDTEEYGSAIAKILRDLAGRDRVVIVGRGGQAVLADTPGALHLRLIADDGYLVSRLVEEGRYGTCSETEILKKIRHHSEIRQKFVRRHFGADWADPLNYHLVMNLSRLTAEEAEDLVAGLVRSGERRRGETPTGANPS